MQPDPVKSSKFSYLKSKLRIAYEMLSAASSNIGFWLFSILSMLILPCLPVIIELLHNGSVKSENLILTAAVLAAGFAFTVEHILVFVAYSAIFLGSLVIDLAAGPSSPVGTSSTAGPLLIAVCGLHTLERFRWHVVLSLPFPENMIFRRRKASPEDEA